MKTFMGMLSIPHLLSRGEEAPAGHILRIMGVQQTAPASATTDTLHH